MKLRIVLHDRQAHFHSTAARILAGTCVVPIVMGCFLAVIEVHGSKAADRRPVRPTAVKAPAAPEKMPLAPEAPASVPAVSVPVVRAEAPKPAEVKTPVRKEPTAPPAGPATSEGDRCRLLPMGATIMLAADPASLGMLLEDRTKLSELVAAGSLFTVLPGTTAELELVAGDFAQVRILEGGMSGKTGWIPQKLTRLIPQAPASPE